MRTQTTKSVEVTEITCDWCGVFIRHENPGGFASGFGIGPFDFHNETCYNAAVAAFTVLLAETRKGVGT